MRNRTTTLILVCLGWLLIITPALAAPSAPTSSSAAVANIAPLPEKGEVAIFMRLLSPCCYQQTLDVHDSPLSTKLRGEIRQRLRAGEAPEAIERSMVARYGERIVALSRDDPLDTVSAVLALLALLVGVGLVGFARRWVRASAREGSEMSTAVDRRDHYDDQLDAELEELEA